MVAANERLIDAVMLARTLETDVDATTVLLGMKGGLVKRFSPALLRRMVNDSVWVTDEMTAVDVDATAGANAARTKALAQNKPVYFPGGATYVVDCLDWFTGAKVILAPTAVLKLKDNATLQVGVFKWAMRLAGDDSFLVGGMIDVNRDGQDVASYNAAGGSSARFYFGVVLSGTANDHSQNIHVDTKIINAPEYGLHTTYCDGLSVRVRVESSGAVASFREGIGGVAEVIGKNIGSGDWETTNHALDILSMTDFEARRLICRDHDERKNVALGAKSDWMSTLTVVDSPGLTGELWDFSALEHADVTKGLGISVLDSPFASVKNISLRGYSSVGLEHSGWSDSYVGRLFVDGRWQTSSLFPSEFQVGMHSVIAAFYPDFRSRTTNASRNLVIGSAHVMRMRATGIHLYAGNEICFNHAWVEGCRDGINVQNLNTNTSWTVGTVTTRGIVFKGGGAVRNERYGCANYGSIGLKFFEFDFRGNGQAKTAPGNALRLTGTFSGTSYGYVGLDLAPNTARQGVELVNCLFDDQQTVTTTKISWDPGAPLVVSVDTPDLWSPGQSIRIKNGATGPVDFLTQVSSIRRNELTLRSAPTATPLVSPGGTIRTIGTAITGAGTGFLAAMKGPTWVKAGGEFRKVISVASDTSATLDTAFSADLPLLTAWEIVQTTVEQMVCQSYGVGTSNSRDDGLVLTAPRWGGGHLLGNTLLLSTVVFSDMKVVANNATLQGLSAHDGQVVRVMGRVTPWDGSGGEFRFSTANLSTQVTNDPSFGVYVPPTTGLSGASGAWIRILENLREASPLFWRDADTAAGNKTALLRAVAFFTANFATGDECVAWYPGGSYSLTGDITIERPRTVLEARLGIAELQIDAASATGIVFQVAGAGSTATASDYLQGCGLRGGIRIEHAPSATSAAAADGSTLWFRQCQNIIWDDQVTISSTAFRGVRISGGQLNETMNALRVTGRYAPPTRRVSASNLGTEVLTSVAHGWTTGWRLVAMDTAAGVTNGSFYYVRVIDADTFTLHLTKADALANVSAVNITVSIAASSPQLRLRRIGSAAIRVEEAECAPGVYQTPYTCGWESVSPIGDFAGTVRTVTGITQANPAVVTSVAHGFTEGQEIRLSGIGGMTEIIGGCYVATNVTADTFQVQVSDANGAMQNVNSTAYTAFTSGGSATAVTRWDFLLDLERADGFWINRGYWGSCRYAYIHMHRERAFGGVYGAFFGKIYADAVDADSTSYRSPLYLEWVPPDDFAATSRIIVAHESCQFANMRSQASSFALKYHNATCAAVKWSNTDFRFFARRFLDITGVGGGTFQFSNCTIASAGLGAGALIPTDDMASVASAEMLSFMGCEWGGAAAGKTRLALLAGTIDHFLCHSVFDGTSNDITSSATINNQSVLNSSGATTTYGNQLSEVLRLSTLTFDGTSVLATFTDWATASPTMETAVAPAGVPIAYTTNTLRWMRLGKKVSFFGNITLSAKGNGSGTVTLVLPAGMPLPNATISTLINIEITTTTAGTLDKSIKADILANTRTIRVRRGDAAGSTMAPLDHADIGNTTVFRFSGEYETP